ncbi:hypothetical protein [Bacillus coahuilensis]|uniref:hypothetical protein n=1 Tax=Bacillus coahuilensis TaxID=408580 RepID=UPI00018514D1|nr:hypothetical protein [Bacillus coahuilensis]
MEMESTISITYVQSKKVINQLMQVTENKYYTLTLLEWGISTHDQTFSILEVLDISYRSFSNHGGILYLHTTKGLFPFHIKESPEPFIEKCQEWLEQKNRG